MLPHILMLLEFAASEVEIFPWIEPTCTITTGITMPANTIETGITMPANTITVNVGMGCGNQG